MLTRLDCASCIIDDLKGALLVTAPDEQMRLCILREAMEWLGEEFDEEHIPSYYITRVHRLLKDRTGVEMPFKALREKCNQAGIEIRDRLQDQLTSIPNDERRMRELALWAIAGNHLDFRTVGTGYDLATDDILAQLTKIVEEGLQIDDTARLVELARQKPRVLYLCDNVGEIALDTMMVRNLQRHGCYVVCAVKGGPITSDAIMSDAIATGMDKVADEMILTGPDTLGLGIDEMSDAVKAELGRVGLVLSKGQANYYACSELIKTMDVAFFCLLRTKCLPAASGLGLKVPRANVAALLTR